MVSRSILAGIILLAINGAAFGQGKTFNNTVQAGVLTELHFYSSWQEGTCKVNGGVVRAVSKPQHGHLFPQKTMRMFERNIRGEQTNCWGKSYPAFVISYRSDPNFRGADSFSVQVTLGNGTTYVDHYDITVH